MSETELATIAITLFAGSVFAGLSTLFEDDQRFVRHVLKTISCISLATGIVVGTVSMEKYLRQSGISIFGITSASAINCK